MKLLKGIYGDIWWSLSPAWRKHYVEYMMCHMDWNNSVLKKTNETTKEVAAGKHNCRGRIVRIPGKKGNVSNSWSHCCALWQLLGFGYRKTPDLKTLYKISSKTQLLSLKISQVPCRQVELTALIANTKAPKSLWSEWANSISSNLRRPEAAKETNPVLQTMIQPGIPSLSRSHRLLSTWQPTDRTFWLAGGYFIPDKQPAWMAAITPGLAELQLTQLKPVCATGGTGNLKQISAEF